MSGTAQMEAFCDEELPVNVMNVIPAKGGDLIATVQDDSGL